MDCSVSSDAEALAGCSGAPRCLERRRLQARRRASDANGRRVHPIIERLQVAGAFIPVLRRTNSGSFSQMSRKVLKQIVNGRLVEAKLASARSSQRGRPSGAEFTRCCRPRFFDDRGRYYLRLHLLVRSIELRRFVSRRLLKNISAIRPHPTINEKTTPSTSAVHPWSAHASIRRISEPDTMNRTESARRPTSAAIRRFCC